MAVWNTDPIEQIQKYIDNFLKYVQTNIDITYGTDNDNSEQPININDVPLLFQGTCIRQVTTKDISGTAPNGYNGTAYITYDLNFWTTGQEMISNIQFLGGDYSTFTNLDNAYYLGLWTDFEDMIYTCSLKQALVGGNVFIPNDSENNNSFYKRFHVYKNEFDYTAIVDAHFETEYGEHNSSNFYLCPWNVDYTIHDSNEPNLQGRYVEVVTNGVSAMPSGSLMGRHLATTKAPSFLFTTNDTIINNYYDYGGNTYNDNSTYINNNGDTINTYYGDNYILVAPVVGAGGVVNFNFDDLVGALELAVDDLNLNFGLSGSDALYVPTYDQLKYEDMGSFYITPIKQLDTLPVAPDIADTVIDVSEPLSILSDGFGALLSCFDSLGVTLTLTFTFLSCLIINKLRGD